MRLTHFWLALLMSAVLAACGGNGSDGDHPQRNHYSAQVTFGDSLSDVGTYAVGAVAAAHGGKYTINGDNTATNPALTGKNWTELIAAQLGPNFLGAFALACNASNLIAGDVRHYLFADSIHPTPFENALLARFTSVQMIQRGWL